MDACTAGSGRAGLAAGAVRVRDRVTPAPMLGTTGSNRTVRASPARSAIGGPALGPSAQDAATQLTQITCRSEASQPARVPAATDRFTSQSTVVAKQHHHLRPPTIGHHALRLPPITAPHDPGAGAGRHLTAGVRQAVG